MGFAEFIIGRASRDALALAVLRFLGGERSVLPLAKFPSSLVEPVPFSRLIASSEGIKSCWSNAV
ncbi:hypothetical protein SAMN05216374_2042 [Tardiphaga sp. OK246]|jgi:hypothetical protein|nr:hypothetical protein [Tardiphaga robiniae]SNS95105.1 hypothetical protein SAMN05216374_2042 [Tardiphaga sp. OK246]